LALPAAMRAGGCVVFVSMEIHLEGLPTYAGGLGLLAGDLLQSAADLGYPMVGVTLLHDRGYVWHEVRGGEVVDREEPYDPLDHHERLGLRLRVELSSGPLHLAVWCHRVRGLRGEVPVYLLDANVPENPPELRGLTSRVYIEGSEEERLLKELALGVGTLELCESLGLDVAKFHVNESHGGFLAIELLKRLGRPEDVRQRLVFTTHTPLPYGHEEYSYELVERHYDVPPEVKGLSPERLRLTHVLMKLSGYYNCVSRKFYLLHRSMFPGSEPDYVTNGVHHLRWVHPRVAALYDRWLEGWREDPTKLAHAPAIPPEEVAKVKMECKRELVEYLNSRAVVSGELEVGGFIASARRRITGYKRVTMVLRRRELLEELGKRYDLQLVFSGTVHPRDAEGREELRRILDALSTLAHVRVAFLGARGEGLERLLAAGSDLWLHTPRPPLEACGTSWMRAALNLTPTLASRDGGVLEGISDGHNGWLFGANVASLEEPYDESRDEEELYSKLREILELYARDRRRYVLVSTYAAAMLGYFNSHRALKEYAARAYRLPPAPQR